LPILNGKPNRIGVVWPTNSKTILADSFDGRPFEAVNDLVVDKKDGVYFTLSNSGTVLYARPVRRSSRCMPIPSSGSTASH
jgi:sugar lactone lactonase YvrE